MAKRRIPTEKRFWAKVNKMGAHDCWEWNGYTTKFGYGQINIPPGHVFYTHRLSWEMHRGAIPDGLCVLHKCDNPKCVNPNHLFLGTKRQNTLDMMSKGRHMTVSFKGEANPSSKLSDDQVLEIKQAISSGVRNTKLAKQFIISQSTISAIKTKRQWTHL